MLNLEVKTKLSQEEVVDRLKAFFGKGGLGLDVAEETQQCIVFESKLGHVAADICPEEGQTRVNLKTQEWDYQVKEFASRLP